jgi:hypothetical protein
VFKPVAAAMSIERLGVAHAGDNDNVYVLGIPPRPDLIQIDTRAGSRRVRWPSASLVEIPAISGCQKAVYLPIR